jgi:uncharacterized membrane protein YkvA (DUF1232 family)
MASWRDRVEQLKQETYALYLAYKDPRVRWYARVWLALVVGYAFSPIDLIPDFIPILGYLDDLILIPIGVWLALKLIPPQVLVDCRAAAAEQLAEDRPVSWQTAVLIVAIWLVLAVLFIVAVVRALQ